MLEGAAIAAIADAASRRASPAELGRVLVPAGDALERRHRRRDARADLQEESLRGEPCTTVVRVLPEDAANLIVERALLHGGFDTGGRDEARWQREARSRAGVSHHDLTEETAQAFTVSRGRGVAPVDELPSERRRRRELPGAEERD